MAYSQEERDWALYVLSEVGSAREAARIVGCSASSVSDWAAAAGAPRAPRKVPVHLPYEEKAALLRRLGAGERADDLAAEAGVTAAALYRWRRRLREKGVLGIMTEAEVAALAGDPPEPPGGLEELRRRNRELELRVAVLEGTVEILKKDPGADPSGLTSSEGAALVDARRGRCPRADLRAAVGLARSTYYHAREAAARPDPLAWLKPLVAHVFVQAGGAFGSARVHAAIRALGLLVSEKVVRRAMRELGLVARSSAARPAGYSSYVAGLPGEAPNLLLVDEDRDLHDFSAARPGERLVTDITEFRLPGDAKVYLSPAVDLFDGRVVARRAGTSPSAELACSMLRDAVAEVGGPFLAHSDRGMHYRTGEWLRICAEEGVTRSMSRRGHSPDNAAMEGFFGRLKVEFFEGRDWSGWEPEAFIGELYAYIDWYNARRLKAFAEGGRTAYDTIDGRRRRLGLAA